MGRLADEIRRRSEVADDEVSRADSNIQEARIVADLAFETAALAGLTLDVVVDQLAQLEKEMKKLRKSAAKKKSNK
jgi:hypothetical protein